MHATKGLLLTLGLCRFVSPSCESVLSPRRGGDPQRHNSLKGPPLHSSRLKLRGGSDADENLEPEGSLQLFRYRDNELEPVPRFQLKSTQQDFGVDYGAHGFMFDVRARRGALLIVGMQICSGDGCPYDYVVLTNTKGWRQSQFNAKLWTRCGGDTRVYIPDYGHGEYGHLPWTPEGVQVEPGEVRSFCIFSNNDPAAVGYRLAGHREKLPLPLAVGTDMDMTDEPDNVPRQLHVTDRDEHLEILNGRRITTQEPFDHDEADDMARAFLGVIEYHLA